MGISDTFLQKKGCIIKVLGDIAKESSTLYIEPLSRNDIDTPSLTRISYKSSADIYIRGSQLIVSDGDAYAMAYILSAIHKVLPKRFTVTIQNPAFEDDKWGKPIVLIGAHNCKSREVFDKFSNLPFSFYWNYQFIVDDTMGDRFKKCVTTRKFGDSGILDYGIILKLKNQFTSVGKTIIIIAGITERGTAGAAYFFFNNYSKLPFTSDEFGTLIEVPSGFQSARMVNFDDIFGYCIKSSDVETSEIGFNIQCQNCGNYFSLNNPNFQNTASTAYVSTSGSQVGNGKMCNDKIGVFVCDKCKKKLYLIVDNLTEIIK